MKLIKGFDGSKVGREDLRLLCFASSQAMSAIEAHGFRYSKKDSRWEASLDCGNWACRTYFRPTKGMPLTARIEVCQEGMRVCHTNFLHALVAECDAARARIEPYLAKGAGFVHWHGPAMEIMLKSELGEYVEPCSVEWFVSMNTEHSHGDPEPDNEPYEAEQEATKFGWNYAGKQPKSKTWMDLKS